MRVVFLGTGTSHGIPVIGCDCPVCTSDDPRDSRYRASLYIESTKAETNQSTSLVIDTGPEFRLQAIRAHITQLDAILLTHAHADHLHGLDDIRPFTKQRALPIYANQPTLEELRHRFRYLFKTTQEGGGKPKVAPQVCTSESFRIGPFTIIPLPLFHGELPILGWQVREDTRSLTYITDASRIPPQTLEQCTGTDCLVIGALRQRPHPTHFTFDQALEHIRVIKPRRAYITHLCHEHSHEEIREFFERKKAEQFAETDSFPETLTPAYDGLTLEV